VVGFGTRLCGDPADFSTRFYENLVGFGTRSAA
jgi:hypothetical protein